MEGHASKIYCRVRKFVNLGPAMLAVQFVRLRFSARR